MKMKYYFIGCFFFLMSCSKDFLEKKPYNALPVEDALQSEADILVALRGAYASLRNVDLYGRTIPVLGDLMADVTYQSLTNSNRYTFYNQYGTPVVDGNALGMWTAGYHTILRVNNILNSTIDGTATARQYRGEAHAIRALMYFELVRFFAKPFTDNPSDVGVPIITKFDIGVKPKRNTIAEVYALILDDLSKAYNLMTQTTNSSQFTKYAARALEAKVHLTKGDMANARTAAIDVINNGGYTLVGANNYVSYWQNPAPLSNKLETLFEVSSDGVANLGFDALGYIYSQNGYGDMICASDLYNSYTATDVRRSLLTPGTRSGAAVFVNKYTNIVTDRDDTKVLRLSDVYMIAAEASLGTNETDARNYLNAVATRRDPSFIGFTSSGATLLEDILTERRKELAFEGHRFHDLNRLKRAINRSADYPASARTIPYPFNRRLLPIPQAEMDANPNMVQNPGY